jgi:CheY-like chemotaxis protein
MTPSESNQMLDSWKILMVDDELDILLSIKIALEKRATAPKMSVDTFTDPQRALEHFKAHQGEYDLLLVDIRMPIMNGIDFTRAVREINKNVKIALITAFAVEKKELDFLLPTLGVDAFITKPISISRLVELLQGLLAIGDTMARKEVHVKPARQEDKRTILICDEEEEILSIYSNAFYVKYNVVTARSGHECIEKYIEHATRGQKIDLLLVDYGLADMSGSQVAERIKELGGAPVILISSYELDQGLVDDLKERKCIEFALRKPISISSLFKEIDSAMS